MVMFACYDVGDSNTKNKLVASGTYAPDGTISELMGSKSTKNVKLGNDTKQQNFQIANCQTVFILHSIQ